jgi:Secretion system C-terminal sorting domain
MKMYTKKLFIGSSLFAVAVAAVGVINLNTSPSSYKQEDLNSVKGKTSADGAQAYWDRMFYDETTGTRMTAEKINAQKASFAEKALSKSTFPLQWDEKGPDNIGGRTRAIVIDRNNTNNVFAGSVTGGLWKSANGGNTWEKVTSFPGSQTISSATQTQNGTIVIATGVSSFSGEPFSGEGNGIYMSTDLGANWTIANGTSGFNIVRDIVAAENSNDVWISGTGSLKKLNVTTNTLSVPTVTIPGSALDLAISADGATVMCQFGSAHCVSNDGGVTWTNVTAASSTSITNPISNSGRSEYAISKSKINGFYHLYIALTNNTGRGCYKSPDNGATWVRIFGATTHTPGGNDPFDIYSNQGLYGSAITVVPNNPKKMFVAGLDVWSWTESNVANSGQLNQKSQWFTSPTQPNYVHADNHEFKWASDTKLYIGNDGGIGISPNAGDTWYPANRGYNVTQFYSMSYGPNGEVVGGAQDNGSLYNNYTNNTLQSFDEISGGDGFYCELSQFNKDITFTTVYHNSLIRSGNGGASGGQLTIDYPSGTGAGSYGVVGDPSSVSKFPFITFIKLAEYLDPNSRDSVTYIANQSVTTSQLPVTVYVASATTGKNIAYNLNQPIYFSDTVKANPTLTIKDWAITTNNATPITFNLSEVIGITRSTTSGVLNNYNLSPLLPSGSRPAATDSMIVISGPRMGKYKIAAITGGANGFNHYFGQQINGNLLQTLDLGEELYRLNYTWTRVKVADPYQSILMIYTSANGGELWASKDALRLSAANPKWSIIAKSLGEVRDVEVSENLNHIFVCSPTKITRITGLGNVYSQDATFASSFGYTGASPSFPIAPTGTTTQVVSGVFSGISIDPRDPNFLVVGSGSNGQVKKCLTATTALTTASLANFGPAANAPINDILVDRIDRNLIVLATPYGVLSSNTAVPVWINNSQGFDGVPVTKVMQQWRNPNQGVTKAGEIYISTFGRGIFASGSVLGLGDDDNATEASSSNQNFLNVYPNPTNNTSAIRFNLKESGKVTVMVYSVNGSLVHSFTTNNLEAGEQNIELNVNDLQNGNYIVKAIGSANSATGRLIKM